MSKSIAIFLAFSCLSTVAPAQIVADWPHWRGLNRNGISPETQWSTEGRDEPLWTKKVGLGYSSPSISRGRLFTKGFLEDKKIDVTYCLDAVTGKEIWRFSHPAKRVANMHGGGTLTTVAVAGDHVFVASRMGGFYALTFKDGKVLWQKKLDAELGIKLGPFGLPGSPLVLDDIVYMNVGKTVAMRATDGQIIWQTDDYGYSYSTPTAFNWDKLPCLAIFNAEGLVILDRVSGKELSRHTWKTNYNVNSATPIVVDSRVFISTGYDEKGCAMLELAKPKMKVDWESKRMRSKMNGCLLIGEHLYGFDAKMLKCFSTEGDEEWKFRGLGLGTVIAAGDRLIVLSETGELLIGPVSAEEFKPTHRRQVFDDEGKCWTTPVLSHGLLYLRNSLGHLVCRDHRPQK